MRNFQQIFLPSTYVLIQYFIYFVGPIDGSEQRTKKRKTTPMKKGINEGNMPVTSSDGGKGNIKITITAVQPPSPPPHTSSPLYPL